MEDIFEDIPVIIESSIIMDEANTPINIYNGEFVIKDAETEYTINGVINFDWTPNSGAHFSGTPVIEISDLYKLSHSLKPLNLLIDGLDFGKCFITKTSFGSLNNDSFIKGSLSQEAIYGDKSITVEKIVFTVPNFREFSGLPVKKIDSKNRSSALNRLILENDDFTIFLDKCFNYKNQIESLEEKGGFIITYYGELTNKKGPINYENAKNIFHCLNYFLTFLNGKRTSALFIQGYFSNELIWTDFTDYFVDSYKMVPSWPQKHAINNFNQLWKNFSTLWKENDDRNFLTSAIHWYVEANSNSGFSEGSIIMAQTALELLYNWWIVENKKLILGKDSENINAANKVRLLISQLNIDPSVPAKFSSLIKFISDNKEIVDGSDAIVQMRNAIVHSQEEKRKKLSNIHYKVKYEALQLCLWYIELSLLRILNYDEKDHNRRSAEIFASKAEENVPWSIK